MAYNRRMQPTIVILTDFGNSDPYVGIMKGVIESIAPGTATIDLTHEIPPGDIHRGAFVLWQSAPYFPAETIFLAVVDPGVGTHRHPLILNTGRNIFVAPDNGLLSFVWGSAPQAWELSNPDLALPNPRRTFHGRDIFAPAAAHAARGVPGSDIGNPITKLVRIPNPKLENTSQGELAGQILHADQFGNLVTSLGKFSPTANKNHQFKPWIGSAKIRSIDLRGAKLKLSDGQTLSRTKTFAALPSDQCGFIVGSTGLLEIVANRQSAANLLNLRGAETITLVYQLI
jgi:S-adenosyl-L-methionine hydrolase (adenosine-forming)